MHCNVMPIMMITLQHTMQSKQPSLTPELLKLLQQNLSLHENMATYQCLRHHHLSLYSDKLQVMDS